MKQLSVIIAGLAALALLLLPPAALGQQPGSTTVVEKRFEAADPPAQAEVMQVVLDFAPGAWTPTHTHGGDVYVTVLEGEVSLQMGGATQKFRAGEGWIDSRDEPHAAGNDGEAPARVVATFVLPRGATPTTVVETGATSALPPGPTTVAQYRAEAPALPSPMDVVQRLIEYAPGAAAPTHSHPGPNHVTVLEGELIVREGAAERKVGALQTFVEPAGQLHSAHNMAAGRTRVVAAALVPRGAPYSTVAGQDGPIPADGPGQVGRSIPDEGRAHAPQDAPIQYQNSPPSSGTHYPTWTRPGVYAEAQAPGNWVHSLEHGYVVILYNCPEPCPELVGQLSAFYESAPPSARYKYQKLVITPYPDMSSRITAVAWNRALELDQFDAEQLMAFFRAYQDKGPEDAG